MPCKWGSAGFDPVTDRDFITSMHLPAADFLRPYRWGYDIKGQELRDKQGPHTELQRLSLSSLTELSSIIKKKKEKEINVRELYMNVGPKIIYLYTCSFIK